MDHQREAAAGADADAAAAARDRRPAVAGIDDRDTGQVGVNPNQPLTVVLPASGPTLTPGTVGQAFAINFFLSGGAGPDAPVPGAGLRQAD